ncbi:YoaK family protein [Acetilactobacillus jinshanensis]|nr:YoaK family protein [Acetilactobacillus jinshanensis]URL61083.1 DUF1275 domain-containing protein [uncultured bacterium]
MTKLHQLYQSLPVGMLLCAVGGSLDADSFLLHGHVFAGLQTGNLVLLGAGYSQLSGMQIIKYISALVAFVLGLILTRFYQDLCKAAKAHHFSFSAQMILAEVILLLVVCLLSQSGHDLISIALMSFVGAVQLQTFPKIKGHPFTPLMMMGHMKKTINFMDKGDYPRVIANLLSLISFFIGAIITGLLIQWLNDWALLFAIIMLISIFIVAVNKKAC